MGNQQTKPANAELQKRAVNPPEDWQDGNEFNLISPMSDLSNPSQFRHRLSNGGIKQRNRNSSRSGNNQAHRQTQRSANGVPAPSSFYFDQVAAKGKENSGSRWIESKHRAVKKRATKARKVLTGCLNDKKGIFDGCLVGDKPTGDVHHAHLPSVSPAQEKGENAGQKLTTGQPMLHDTPQVALPQIEEETPQMILAQDTPQLILPTTTGHHTVNINPILQTEEKDVADTRYDGIKAYIHDDEVFVNRIAKDAPNETPVSSQESLASLTNPSSADETPQRDGEAVDDLAQKFFECQPFSLRLREGPPESSPVSETKSVVSGMSQEMINAELQKAVSEALAKEPEGFSPYGSENVEEEEEEVVQVMNIRPPSMESQELEPLGKLNTNSLHKTQSFKIQKGATGEHRNSKESAKSFAKEAKRDTQSEPDQEVKQLDSVKQHALKMAGKKAVAQVEPRESKNEAPPSGNVTKYFSGSSMTQMLLQTYQIMDSTDESFDMETPQKPSMAPLESPAASEATVDTPLSTSSKQTVSRQAIQNATFLFSPSYADGDESLLKLPAPHKGATPFAISTAGSRSRLGSQSRPKPLEYGNEPSDHNSESTQSISTAPTRRVRFSDPEEPAEIVKPVTKPIEHVEEEHDDVSIAAKEVHFHPIQRNFSDITDATGLDSMRESLITIPSAPPSVTPIPEESVCDTEIDEPDADTTAFETELDDGIDDMSVEKTVSTVSNTEATLEDDDEESKQSSGSQYPTNWYSTNMDNGVTPLRSGKSVANATNSPYIRFNAAHKRFSGKVKKSPVKKSPLQKRKSPTRISGGLVKSRILAFQGNADSHQKIESKPVDTSTALSMPASPAKTSDNEGIVSESPWRPPAGNKVSFGRSSDASSHRASISEGPIQKKVSFGGTSTISSGTSRSSSSSVPVPEEAEITYALPKRVSSQTASLTPMPRKSTISEASQSILSVQSRNYESGMDTSVDDFAAILRGDNEEDEEVNDDSFDQDGDTVSTVRQLDRFVSTHPTYSDDNATNTYSDDNATTLSYDYTASTFGSDTLPTYRKPSLAVSVLSNGGSSTISDVLKGEKPVLPFRDTENTVRPNEQVRLPFRDTENTVRPNEQQVRPIVPVPGGQPLQLGLSPTQRTPMQARKWRTLAMKAQENNCSQKSFSGKSLSGKSLSNRFPSLPNSKRKSLQERNINTMNVMY